MNIRLLLKTQNLILSNPAEFKVEDFETDITGFAVKAAGLSPTKVDAYARSRALLRISAAQRDALSFLHLWPAEFQSAFNPAAGTKAERGSNALVAVSRLRYFARTGC
jgi:hypothetical protein